MAKKDVLSNNYFKDKDRVADLLNVYLYNGEQILAEKDIQEINPVLTKAWWNNDELRTNENITDVLYLISIPTDGVEKTKIIVSIQNQSDISYIMPVRVMNADANCYYAQWKDISRNHVKDKPVNSGEFLSGFMKEDKILPVLSLVIYYGRKKWDGARSLHQLMKLPENISQIQAYSLNLIEVREYQKTDKFRTDIGEVFGFLQNDSSKELLEKYIEKHKEVFSDMREDAYDLICIMSHTKRLRDLKIKYQEPGGNYNMCKAIDEMVQESRNEGKLEGKLEGENCITRLYSILYNAGREEDIKRTFTDRSFRDRLLVEYGCK